MKHRFRALASAVRPVALHSVGVGLVVVALSRAVQAGAPAPEIDAGSLVSGLTLLAGGILIVTNRMRRK